MEYFCLLNIVDGLILLVTLFPRTTVTLTVRDFFVQSLDYIHYCVYLFGKLSLNPCINSRCNRGHFLQFKTIWKKIPEEVIGITK
jgi:hypothetical protein